jgi:hypothetical protein
MFVILADILIGALAVALPSLIGRAMLAVGIGAVTYTGLSVGTTYLISQVQSSFSGIPGVALSFLAWCWVDHAISMIASAYTVSLGIKTLSTMNITKYQVKGK